MGHWSKYEEDVEALDSEELCEDNGESGGAERICLGHDKANSSNSVAGALGWVSKFAEGNDGGLGRQESMRRHSNCRMATTKEDFVKMRESFLRRAIYPTLITKNLFTVWPLWCLVVQDEREEA